MPGMHVRVDGLTDGLTEAQVREPVHPAVNPLAWLLWHMARCEDAAVNALVGDGPQVLDDGWLARLGIARRDVGTGMTMAEVRDLSATVDLPVLQGYWTAVGERTAGVVGLLTPPMLDTVVGPERIRRAVVDRGILAGAAGTQLEQAWRGMTVGYSLVYLPLTHNYEHIGQADAVRGMLGRPGAV